MQFKRICALMLVCIMLSLSVQTATYAYVEEHTTRDFTFGLPDRLSSITPLSENADGSETLKRLSEVRQQYPDEIPVFEPFSPEGYKHKVFVSPDGNDRNSGNIDSPLKTIQAAFKQVATMRDRSGGVVIYLREGVYLADETIMIPDSISGTADKPTMICGYNGEKAVVSGGMSISGSSLKVAKDDVSERKLPETVKENILSVNLTEMGFSLVDLQDTHKWVLTIDGTPYDVARWPNSGNVKMAEYKGSDGIKGVLDMGTVASTSYPNYYLQNFGATGFEFQIIDPRPFSWENTGDIYIQGILDVDWINGTYRVGSFNEEKKSLRTVTNTSYGAQYGSSHTYYYFNILEELDIPGEWFIDKNTGLLYIYPINDLTSSIISFSSDVNNVIKFEEFSKNIVLSDINIEGAKDYAVILQGYQNIVQKCTISNVDRAIAIDSGKNCGIISNNLISNSYENTVRIRKHLTSNMADGDEATLTPTRNFVQNNTIVGSLNTRGGVQNIISHNEINNARGMCVYVAEEAESIFEFNEITGGPWSTIDGGLIYVEGVAMTVGNIIRHNYLHDGTLVLRTHPFGIYLDNTASGQYVYGNILQECTIFMHGGSDNAAYNNVVIDETTDWSIYNSDKFWSDNFKSVTDGHFLDKFDYYQPQINGKYKFSSEEWMNRFPALYDSWENLITLRRLYKDEGRENLKNTEEWDKMFGVKRCAYVNNVIYNSKPLYGIRDAELQGNPYYANNVSYTTDDDIFVDYKNKNYNIKKDSKVFEDIKDFEPLPPQERMGVLIAENLINNYGKYSEIFPLTPVSKTEEEIYTINETALKWTKDPYATYYNVTLAKDPEFTDIVRKAETKSNSILLSELLEFDTTYYWKVEAIAEGQRFKGISNVMPTAKFKVGSYEQLRGLETLDYSAYNQKLNEIKELLSTIYEEDAYEKGVTLYETGTKNHIMSLIEKSQQKVNEFAFNYEIEKEIENIYKETLLALAERVASSERSYKAENFKLVSDTAGKINVDNDVMSVVATDSYNTAYDDRMIGNNETVSVNVNFGELKAWIALGLKQTSLSSSLITGTKGYFLVVSPPNIELQKYPKEGGNAIKVQVPMEGVLSPDTYHKLDYNIEPVENGLRIIVNIDGKKVIDWVDEKPLYDFGYFSIMHNRNAGTNGISIKLDSN